ncbi:NADPH-dependent F420 reductase [Flagellimonas sp.]|uniref:NADPH-dependent F420 reductase n=1 Tax=Flagellimonas sp. TaxID=2058762 RepID=UPI003F4A0E97
MKKIGIIGSGIVAQTLGAGFIKHGYDVMLGTRNIDKLAAWQSEQGTKAKVGSFEEAAEFGKLLVLAVKGTVAKTALDLIGNFLLENKTIMDATNPIADQAPENGVLQFFTNQNESLMEQLQSAYPKANFVKAFSSVGSAKMVNPTFEIKPSMFICGNSNSAKEQVSAIVELFGWEVEDMGSAEAARAIEPLCMLWCIPGFLHNQWTHAFKLLK